MASKFQRAIAELRSKMAVQGAETVARLKQIETDLHAKLDEASTTVHLRLTDGFSEFEQALAAQQRQQQDSLNVLLDLSLRRRRRS